MRNLFPFQYSRGGGSHIDMIYLYVPAFEVLFREIWYTDQGVFIRDEGAQISQLGVFRANYSQKGKFGQNWVLKGIFSDSN